MSDPVKVEFAYPSVKEQSKQAFIGTVVGLAPLAVFVGGAVVWSKIQDKRNSKKPEVADTVEPPTE